MMTMGCIVTPIKGQTAKVGLVLHVLTAATLHCTEADKGTSLRIDEMISAHTMSSAVMIIKSCIKQKLILMTPEEDNTDT
jgi:hypothetical protein